MTRRARAKSGLGLDLPGVPGHSRIMVGFRLSVSAALALVAGGCMLQAERPVALATPEAPTTLVKPPPAGVKTVRRTALSDADDASPTGDGIPRADQIFDFHPAGSKPDTWRQPFIIDPNDGPLAAYQRQTAQVLKELQDPKLGPTPPVPSRSAPPIE